MPRDKMNDQTRNLMELLDENQKEINQLELDIKNLKLQKPWRLNEKKTLVEKLNKAEAQLKNALARQVELRNMSDMVDEKADKLADENNQFRDKMSDRTRKLMELRDENQKEISQLQLDIKKLNLQKPKNENERRTLAEKLKESEAQLKIALARQVELRNLSDMVDEKADKLEDKNVKLQDGIEEQKQNHTSDEPSVSDTTHLFDLLQKDVALHKSEIDALKSHLEDKDVLDSMWQDRFFGLNELQVTEDQDKSRRQLARDDVQAKQFKVAKDMWVDSHSRLMERRLEQDRVLLERQLKQDMVFAEEFELRKKQWQESYKSLGDELDMRDESLHQKLAEKNDEDDEQFKMLDSLWQESVQIRMDEQRKLDETLKAIQVQKEELHVKRVRALNNEWQKKYWKLIEERTEFVAKFRGKQLERKKSHAEQLRIMNEQMKDIDKDLRLVLNVGNGRGKRETYNAKGEELWRMVEDQKAEMASKFNLTTSGGQGNASLPTADQRLFCLCGDSGNYLN